MEEKTKENTNNPMLRKYIHHIRNSKTFSKETLETINQLSFEDRMDILLTYNEMITFYSKIMEDDD